MGQIQVAAWVSFPLPVTAAAALKHGTADNVLYDVVLVPALDALTTQGKIALLSTHLLDRQLEAKLEDLPDPAVDALMRNCVCCQEIGYDEQIALMRIVRRHENKVWQLFESRASEASRRAWNDRYEASPDHWDGLEAILGRDVEAAFDRVACWPEPGTARDRYKTEFLGHLFKTCSPAFVDGAVDLVRKRGSVVAGLMCGVLQYFNGHPGILPICRELIATLDPGDRSIGEVAIALRATGGVSGEMGMAVAYEAKAEAIRPWLTDTSERVRAFAVDHIADLERMAIEERRRGTERRELRKRDFG